MIMTCIWEMICDTYKGSFSFVHMFEYKLALSHVDEVNRIVEEG